MASTAKKPNPSTTPCPRVLVVDDENTLLELIGDVVAKSVNCTMLSAANLREARQIIAHQPIELLVADVNLPDGNGMSLLKDLHNQQPQAGAIVITGSPSVDGAIAALRQGATDFLPKPFSADQLVDRLNKALQRQALLARHEKRLDRLRDAVRRLNDARKIVSKKVDLLCNDLITAYGELARQFDVLRTQEGFRKYLTNSKDLEQLLCHTMDWLLRQMGYSNVAIYLAADEQQFQLGAYMKYTIAGDKPITDALRQGLVPLTIRQGAVHFAGEELPDHLSTEELNFLHDQSIIAVNCTYLGEALAVVLMFREVPVAFTDEDLAVLKHISPIFALALADMVRGSPTFDKDNNPFYDGDDDEDDKREEADWWKRGENPPF
jgi:DNA-binding response OmpR family regulator